MRSMGVYDKRRIHESFVANSKAFINQLRKIKKSMGSKSMIRSLAMAYLERVEKKMRPEYSKLAPKDILAHQDWLNVSAPLSLQHDLRGKIVLIDFWTYCCINCIHTLPQLAKMEQKYEKNHAVVFLGCHSAKFQNEKETDAVRNAVIRYGVTHPVINDQYMQVWHQMMVKCWPTLLLLGPDGFPILQASGEGHRQHMEVLIDVALEYYGKRLNPRKCDKLKLEDHKSAASTGFTEKIRLKFPGKIEAIHTQHPSFPLESQTVLVISDTGNNRLLIIDQTSHRLLVTIGNGSKGFTDGSFTQASFNSPQGCCYIHRRKEHLLFVCDTNNHAIRCINLNLKKVGTVVGNGSKGLDKNGGGYGRIQKLASPWDIVALNNNDMLIAMAGHHQIWLLDLDNRQCVNWCGNGKEGNLNSNMGLKVAKLAQPSGLSFSQDSLFFADSQSSAVRGVDLITEQRVFNIAGGDHANARNLHHYGDEDGTAKEAKLQHPLGLDYVPELNILLVSDTYNHKVKVIWQEDRLVRTWLGNGSAGVEDGNVENVTFNEPSDLCHIIDEEHKLIVYVADTNNHCIRRADGETGDVRTVQISPYEDVFLQGSSTAPAQKVFGSGVKKAKGYTSDSDAASLVSGGDLDKECDAGVCYPKWGAEFEDPDMVEAEQD